MTKNSSDQFSKQFLEEILSPFGTVETSYEVSGEAQWVDVFFVPTTQSQIHELGLLGRIAQMPCLIEPFRNQPSTNEVRSCLLKLFQVQGHFRRQARRRDTSITDFDLPSLWILASSASDALLQQFEATAQKDWPSGVYFLPLALKTAIVSINQLSYEDETLWLRLLGKGRTQREAISQVLCLDPEDPRRSAILKLVTNWKISIEVTQQIEAQEEELLMALSQAYLEWEKTTEQRGEQRGRTEGKTEEARSLILRLLNRRIGTINSHFETQISELSVSQLEALGEALLDFSSSTDLEQWLQSQS
jgi:Domain of unknown function (DUF4351)